VSPAVHEAKLTPIEQYVDELIRHENRERYIAQHAATQAGAPAPFPPRAPLLPIMGNPYVP
jgi:hypothetical protein